MTPTPGPSEPRHYDATKTQGESTTETAAMPDRPDAAGDDGTQQYGSAIANGNSSGIADDVVGAQNEPTGAEHEPTGENGDGAPPERTRASTDGTDSSTDSDSSTDGPDSSRDGADESTDGTGTSSDGTDSPKDGAAGTAKVTPADLVAATRRGVGPGAGKPPAGSTDQATGGTSGATVTGTSGTGDDSEPEPEESEAAESGAAESGAAESGTKESETVARDEWGRVDVNGEVYLRTAEGERHIGSWQVGEPDKALAFYRRKFDDLVVQVDLLEQRLSSGAASPESAEQGIAKLRKALVEPHAIGDLDSLRARLEALREQISERRAERKAARAHELDEARARKERVAGEAEEISHGDDWRHGADRLRQLLDEWKSLPRLDRATDDALWRRFSTARTHYTRRRKAHFAELAERRENAREIKEEILAEAEELAESTDWGGTARRFRELMSRWKAAGPAPRSVDEALWKRFRAAQDTFFEARSATFAQRDAEQQENLKAKEALLAEAEGLLPVSDWKAARAALRSIQERWESVGHVPRESMKSVESRLRKVEDSIRQAEQSDWQRTNPEARARAEDTVAQLRTSISELEARAAAAREAGNERKAAEADQALAARRAWLEQAERALDDLR